MKLTNFLIWLASGGLVTLVTYVGFRLLKSAERLDNTNDEKLWKHLLQPGGTP